ncbi:MAG: DUF1446 domain-containing protein [Thermoplasmata archaeon]|nr:MAG: DUF1446 domain-containing protein [Thermoplasmata archaeon]
MVDTLRIGTGAGYSGDRIEPAASIAKSGDLDYLVFECLAERTMALAHLRRLSDPDSGYDPLLEERLRLVLSPCVDNKIKIITNMGAANPLAAGKKTRSLLNEMGHACLKVGIVLEDDILDAMVDSDFSVLKEPDKIHEIRDKIISANTYLGASPIIELLKSKADIIITGRTCDPSLFLAPMMHEHGWKDDDWDKIGFGITVAHLMECGAQVTGGYFADPGYKNVEGLANLSFPIAEIFANQEAVITKLPDTGGEVSLRTVKEQLLYEVHDPSSYKTADGIADFTKIKLEEKGQDMVKISGGGGRARPAYLKVNIGFRNGFLGEAQISYGGYGAKNRAQLAAQILMKRFADLKLDFEALRFDFIGSGSLWPGGSPSISNEIRLRVIGRARIRKDVEKLCNEVEALYTNGPAGGGGVTRSIEENIAITSAFIPREIVTVQTKILGEENGQD